MNEWFTGATHRLLSAGFVMLDQTSANGSPFKAVARRSRFEVTKFGFYETFFVFAEFGAFTISVMQRFSRDAFHYASRHKKIPLPCGLFEGICCFAVAIAPSVDEAVKESIQNGTPPKHWAATEFPVVYDCKRKELFYFERTPVWGAAYYAGFRMQLGEFLAESKTS